MKASIEGVCASLFEDTSVLNLGFTVPMYELHISSESEKKEFFSKEKNPFYTPQTRTVICSQTFGPHGLVKCLN